MEAELSPAKLAAVVLLNLSVATMIGATLAGMWLHGRRSAWAVRTAHQLRRVTLAAFAPAAAAYLALLWLEAAFLAEVPLAQAGPAVHSLLTATHYGFAWKAGSLALAVAAALAIANGALALRLLALAVFLYSRSMVSHAGAAADFGWAIAADWLHFVLAGVWVGAVIVAGFVALPRAAAGTAADAPDRAHYVRALSMSATIALAGIVATGLANAWNGLGSLANASGNPYANALLAKLVLVLAAAALGGFNRFRVMPALLQPASAGDDAAARRFVLVLRIESVLLFAALVLAAILSSTPPPGAA